MRFHPLRRFIRNSMLKSDDAPMKNDPAMNADANPPLVVDLDGTLITCDTTHELLVLCARWKPNLLPAAVYGLATDRAAAKRWLSELFGEHINPAHLPYDETALDLIREHRAKGGTVWLVSGSDHLIVQRIAEHLGLFDHAQGSEPGRNLTAANKASYLTEEFPTGFTYAGNSRQDFSVWKESAGGFGFRAPSDAYALTGKHGGPVEIKPMAMRTRSAKPLLKAMRLHQWAKNILVFVVPGLMLSELGGYELIKLVAAFVCFGLMASGTYILNDLFDIPDDRKHPTKSKRQLAAGLLSVPTAILAMLVMVLGSLGAAILLDTAFGLVLLIYAVTTVAYSFRLKKLPIVDVLVLAGLFSLRVWGGAVIVSAPPTAWLMMFIGLVFLSLALAKRYVEVQKTDTGKAVPGRGYRSGDEAMLLAFGAGTANAAVLSLAVYGLLAPQRLIDNPEIMMVVAVIVGAWFMRIWLVAVRGELNEDPVLYAVKDRLSLICLALVGVLIASESLKPYWSQWF